MNEQVVQTKNEMQLVIISGLSGAGKSVALRVLEDLGYYCVDNLPVNLLNQFVRTVGDRNQNVAVSVDIRNLPNDPELVTSALAKLRAEINLTLFFFDASQETLLKRYSETRRIHPLSLNEDKLSLDQAIMEEKSQIDYLKELSDLVIDSSGQSIHDLSELIRMRVLGRERQELVMVFESFGFKYGIPTDADYVFDVRFLPNPHWEPSLRPFSGLDKPVIDYLEAQPSVVELKADIQAYIEKWLPMLEKNNRSYLTVAIGCTGGKHRSVYLTHALGELFKKSGKQVQIRHTSLEKIANPL